MKAVHFGPGNIGRGFIGLLLSQSGYEVCFAARNERQVSLLNERRRYTVTLANVAKDQIVVDNVSAVLIQDADTLAQRIAEADVVTTAVGASALKHIAGAIAKGIELRLKQQIHQRPLHVMACENVMNGSSLLKRKVYAHLDAVWHAAADRLISFPNTLVDRIIPDQTHEDPLAVRVEPFFEWIVHRPALKPGFGGIEGIRYAESLEPYLERKLFTVNTGHCSAAYLGYLAGYRTIQEAMKDPRIKDKVRKVMEETGQLLIEKYGFNELEHKKYIQNTLERFSNPSLIDKVVRVGRSPLRKLSSNDRLIRPAMQAHEMGLDVPNLVTAVAAGLLYDYVEDPEAIKLQSEIRQTGVNHVVDTHMGIPEKHRIHRQIVADYEQLRQRFMLKLKA